MNAAQAIFIVIPGVLFILGGALILNPLCAGVGFLLLAIHISVDTLIDKLLESSVRIEKLLAAEKFIISSPPPLPQCDNPPSE